MIRAHHQGRKAARFAHSVKELIADRHGAQDGIELQVLYQVLTFQRRLCPGRNPGLYSR